MKNQPSQAGKTTGSPGDSPADAGSEKKPQSPPSPAEPSPAEPLRIPPLLFEGDDPPESQVPPQPPKFALTPAAPASSPAASAQELPQTYGTGHLLLLARDPNCLFAHWDLSAEQQQAYRALARGNELVLRVSSASLAESEISLPSDSNSSFVQVTQAGTPYVAELGYYRQDEWVRIAISDTAITPAAIVSTDKSVRFAQASELKTMVESVPPIQITPPSVQWIPALENAPDQPPAGAERLAPGAPEWTLEQERALADMLGPQTVSRQSTSSLELAEWARREIERSIAAVQFGQSLPGAVSSPLGAEPRLHAFWFNVNAEVIVYGATDPSAAVTIGGRPVELRPDGTFSFRLSLPDGEYELELAATSVLKEERYAQLKFRRCSAYGERASAG